jgi:ribosomal protein S18 acetylase RimI-like enzyme
MIRPLVAGDIARIKEIDAASFAPEDQYGDATYDLMLRTGQSVVLEDASGIVVAYAFVQMAPHSALRSIAVHPDHRRGGYARMLLDCVTESATDAVDLFVDETNVPALTLYESAGFERMELCPTVKMRRRMLLAKAERGKLAECPACSVAG